MSKKKFVASYSGGKDSVLAIQRAKESGLELVQLITTYNIDKERSWFHGIPSHVLDDIADSVGVPIELIKTSGEEYAKNFELALEKAKNNGAEICVFGDIDIEDHRTWCTDRCEAVGIEAMFPLWNQNRLNIVHEFIDKGFVATITVVNNEFLGNEFLGLELSRKVIDKISSAGADACGENGEYHTFVSDGGLFGNKINVEFGEIINQDNYGILPIV